MRRFLESSNLGQLHYDWEALLYEQGLETEEEIAEFLELNLKDTEELNGYYKHMIQVKPEHKDLFDVEYRSRRLEDHVAPETEELEFFKNSANLSKDLIMDIARARTLDSLLASLNQYHGRTLSSLLCISLVIAISIGKTDLATDLKLYIDTIGTFTSQLSEFLRSIDESFVSEVQQIYTRYIQALQAYKQRRAVKVTKKLTEASSSLTPYEKMDLFNRGQRRENVKACSIDKLTTYYKICLENGFKRAERIIALELEARKAGAYIAPNPVNIDASQFTVYEAKFVLDTQNTPDKIVEAAVAAPFAGLTISDTLTIYLIWAIVLKLPKVIDSLKRQIKLYDTYYSLIPELLTEISNRPGVAESIADSLKSI